MSRTHRAHRVRPQRGSLRRRIAAALVTAVAASGSLLVGSEAPVEAAIPLTLRTVTIDGSFEDWDAVLANPLQTTRDGDGSSPAIKADCGAYSTDRDCPHTGGAGRDFLTFAWTYDTANVYLYIERYGSTTNTVDFLFVADVNRDGRVDATRDVVVHANWLGTSGNVAVSTWTYEPADATDGDPIACAPVPPATHCLNAAGVPAAPAGYVDGYKLPGNNRDKAACPACSGSAEANGSRLELAVPWSVFRTHVDAPFYWHVLSSNNDRIRSTIDNIGAPNGKLGSFVQRGVAFAPDRAGVIASPGQVAYRHTLTNEGNDEDVFDLVATSSQGAQVDLLEDEILLATDTTGDGTWDWIASGRDANGNDSPDVRLLAGASRDLSIRLTLPAGRAGTDVTQLVATSGAEPLVQASVADTSQIGTAAFLPAAQRGYTIAAQPLPFRDVLRNAQPVAGTFRVVADAGCAGSRLELAADAAGSPGAIVAVDETGDGTWDTVDAAGDGDLVPELGAIEAGGTSAFHLVVTPPPAAAAGTSCTATLSATSDGTGATAAVRHEVLVAEKVTFAPDHRGASAGVRDAADAQVATGSSIFLPATLRNAESSARAYDLLVSMVGGAGASARVWSDPDGDGNPSDGAVITRSNALAPFGGEQHVVIEIHAGTAETGSFIVTTTTARALDGGAEGAQVSEVVVGFIAAYADALLTNAANAFAPCSTIHLGARGLTAGDASRYALSWLPPSGAPPPAVAPWATTAIGTASAQLALGAGAALGPWTAQLLDGGAPKDEVAFTVELAGTIPTLATDRVRYRPGEAVAVNAAVRNGGGARLEDTTLAYSGAATRTRALVDVGPGQTVAEAFTFQIPADAPPGLHGVTLGWRLSCGEAAFVSRTATFEVAPPPPMFTAPGAGARLADPTPVLEGTGFPGAEVVVTLSHPQGDARISPPIAVDGAGRWSWTVPDLGALSDGSHTATATQTAAGVASDPSAPVVFEIDAPPAAPVIGAPATGTTTRLAEVAVSGTASDPESASVEILVDGVVVASPPVVGGTFSASLTLEDGTHVLTARALDVVGNASAASEEVAVTVDRSAPAAAVVDRPAAGSTVPAGQGVLFSGSAEAGATVVISIDGGVPVDVPVAGDGAWLDVLQLADGEHTATIAVRDAAGNTSLTRSVTFLADSLAPLAPELVAPVSGAATNAATIAVSGTAEAGAIVHVLVGSEEVTTMATDATFHVLVPLPSADGDLAITAVAVDAAGNASPASLAVGITVDRTVPDLPTFTAPALTSLLEVPMAGTAEAGAAVRILDGAAVVLTTTATASGTFAAQVALPEGRREIRIEVADRAGNTAIGGPLFVEIDRTAPGEPSILAPGDGAELAPGTVEVRGTAEPGALITVTAAGATATARAGADGAWSLAIAFPDGSHGVTATATDDAGNVSAPTEISVLARLDDGAGSGGGCGCRTGTGGGAPALLALAAVLALAPPRRRRGRLA